MLETIRGKLVVSCQALPEEPLHSSFIMGRMALAAQQGGAAGIRAQGREDILEIRRTVHLPVIGIVKRYYPDSEIYITPTQKEADELLETHCEMIALDATARRRPNGETLEELVGYLKGRGACIMADISTYEEGMAAEKLGFDCVSTTLCGYTEESENLTEPNYELIRALAQDLRIPLIGEGKIHTPQELKAVFEAGAYAAVVGGAITRPQEITACFTREISK